jgi:hypothetical protein
LCRISDAAAVCGSAKVICAEGSSWPPNAFS